ncbi:hypothetical protein A6302_01969 [Methylobrevis pamukkalensis]|uniref:Uncharacterized protein n=2 Tax=Methylobrevis pamukkalensis TaxID=1439726 RepID=A0A1E3H317_9HYPH|nr:hypothetical protein A6302_01969 [Methylobrevis pamukkalensis]
MSGEVYAALVITISGFVAAGLISSFYQLVTARPCAFDIPDTRPASAIASILTCMFAGPMILMRNAVRGRFIERRPIGWLFASTLIAGGWSLCSGTVVLSLVYAVQGSI